MEVHGQRVHRDDFGLARAHQAGQWCGQRLVITDPRTLRLMVAQHAEAPPIGQFLFDVLRSGLGLQAQRMPG